ncbi:TPA: HD domain-containing protein [Burkholderia vietnamiensis]|nr:HD domain-containing protein [Burkholderia vietnamiensis]
MSIPYQAMLFAREKHKMQRRKYTNNPYSDHLAEVAGIASTVLDAFPSHLHPIMIATSWLHDTIEDTDTTQSELLVEFGEVVHHGVMLLSDMEPGNRATRKALSRARLSLAPAWVQSIKCADLISNTSSIVMHDPAFAAVYLEEKRMLLDVLTSADSRLLELARGQCS